MTTDLLLVFVLILLNGLFAMSEIAIVSSRRVRLVQMAEGGNVGAQRALQLSSEPTRFLSSVQVGITSIGILNGAIGEAAVVTRLNGWFEQVPTLAPLRPPAGHEHDGCRPDLRVADCRRARAEASGVDAPGTDRQHHCPADADSRDGRPTARAAHERVD